MIYLITISVIDMSLLPSVGSGGRIKNDVNILKLNKKKIQRKINILTIKGRSISIFFSIHF